MNRAGENVKLEFNCSIDYFLIVPREIELKGLFESSNISRDIKIRLADGNNDEVKKLKEADFFYSIEIPSRTKGDPIMFNILQKESGLDDLVNFVVDINV